MIKDLFVSERLGFLIVLRRNKKEIRDKIDRIIKTDAMGALIGSVEGNYVDYHYWGQRADLELFPVRILHI